MSYGEIVEKWGLPRKDVSCPSCGELYGSHNTKVCVDCEECSRCCVCGSNNFVIAEIFIGLLE